MVTCYVDSSQQSDTLCADVLTPCSVTEAVNDNWQHCDFTKERPAWLRPFWRLLQNFCSSQVLTSCGFNTLASVKRRLIFWWCAPPPYILTNVSSHSEQRLISACMKLFWITLTSQLHLLKSCGASLWKLLWPLRSNQTHFHDYPVVKIICSSSLSLKRCWGHGVTEEGEWSQLMMISWNHEQFQAWRASGVTEGSTVVNLWRTSVKPLIHLW